MNRRRLAWVALFALAVAVLAMACAGPAQPQPAAEPTKAPAAAAEPTKAPAVAAEPTKAPAPVAAEPTKAAAPAAAKGGEVTEGDQSVIRAPRAQIDNLDPGLMPSVNDVDMQRKMFEGLLDFMDDGTELKLGAESYEVNAAGDVYTFHLRKGAKWSDGQPLTAKDYVWAWRRTLDPKTANAYASTVYIIKNAQPINEGKITDLTQLGAEAVDDYTLKVTLEQPAGFFPRLAAFPTLYPLRQDVVEKFGDKWVEPQNIVSNGKYVLKQWDKDVQLVFERNPNYWGEPAKAAKVVYKLMEDPYSTAPGMFEANELDLAPFAAAEYQRIKDDPVLSKQVVLQPQSATMWAVFDTSVAPFNDVRVRQALSLAIDREGFVKGVLQGLAQPAYILPAPGIVGRNEAASLSSKDYAKDVAKAQQLLADAGFPGGKGFREVELKYRTRFLEQKMGEALPGMWEKALGIKVKGSPTEAQAYREWYRSRAKEKFDMMVYGWSSDYEDPYNWFNAVFSSPSDQYHSRWVNKEYDDLVAKAAGEPDTKKREQMYSDADKILETELPLTPVIYTVEPYLLKPWVTGPIFSRMGNYNLHWATVLSH